MNILADRFYDLLIERSKTIGLFLILFLVPICYGSGETRIFQEKVFVIAGMSYASLFFGSVWITAFFLLNMGLFIWNGSVVGSAQVMNIFVGCILFTAARSYFSRNSNGLNTFTNAMKGLVALNLVYIVFQLFRIDPIFISQDSRGIEQWGIAINNPFGMFNYLAAMGMFFSLAMPFFFSFGLWLPLLLLVPMALASSVACYLSGTLMALYGLFYIRMITFKRKIFYWLLALVLVSGGAWGVYKDYSTDPLTANSRYESWHMFIKFACAKPLFGYGPDSFRNITPHKNFTFSADEDYNPLVMRKMNDEQTLASYYSADESKRIPRFKNRIPKTFADWGEAHNEFIQIFFEYGLFGLTLVGFFLYEIFSRFRLSTDSKEVRVLFGAILCYLAFSTTQFPFHLARIAVFFPIILGAFFAYTDKDWDTFVKGRST